MSAGHVQLAPDGSGKDIDADAVTSTESGTPTVYRQDIVISDPTTYANKAAVTAANAVKVDGSAVTQPVSGTFWQATQPISGTVSTTSTQVIDIGRTPVTITLDAVAGITSEALATMTINKAGIVTTGTSYTVTSGKTLRLYFFGSSVKNTSTVASNSRVRVRSAATVAVTSPIFIANEAGAAAAVANVTGTDDTDIAEGVLIAAAQQIGISHIESATTSTVSCCLIGFEY